MPKKEGKKKSPFNILKTNTHPALAHQWSFGEKASDKLTEWMGSWTFILVFLGIFVAWIFVNTLLLIDLLSSRPWDPYPFILLNLALSTLAAIQAPIILMSQNREAQKDRIRSKYDYAVNRKAEREIQEIKNHLTRIERKLSKAK